MASIIKRKKKYSVVYTYVDESGEKKQKWESCGTYQDALRRKTEVEYQLSNQIFVPPSRQTVRELLYDYMHLYGVNKWAPSTYSGNLSLIDNYINPAIGDLPLKEATPKVMEQFYKALQTTPAVVRKGRQNVGFVTAGTIRNIHKVLRCAFNQAVKWEEIGRNPVQHVSLPSVEKKQRDIWTAEQIQRALACCADEKLRLCIQLSFACSLRIGEATGLQWERVHISDEEIKADNAHIFVDRELAREQKDAIEELCGKQILFTFPALRPGGTTDLVLKTPKTASSVRKVWLPKTLALLLRKWQTEQAELKELLGKDYYDYDLVITQSNGRPVENRLIGRGLEEVAQKAGLPNVVFHSLRHSSTTYKLILNNGDIKATQGDTGHSQADMVTGVYAHILDEDRKVNAQKFDAFFYQGETRPARQPANGPKLDASDASAIISQLADNPELAKALKQALNALPD